MKKSNQRMTARTSQGTKQDCSTKHKEIWREHHKEQNKIVQQNIKKYGENISRNKIDEQDCSTAYQQGRDSAGQTNVRHRSCSIRSIINFCHLTPRDILALCEALFDPLVGEAYMPANYAFCYLLPEVGVHLLLCLHP
jgi:hypothetical protein